MSITSTTHYTYWKPEKHSFEDRWDAGQILGKKLLESYNDRLKNPICLGCVRGGLLVAKGIVDFMKEKNLFCDLDFVTIRKINLPNNKDFGIGAMEEDGTVLFIDDIVKKWNVDVESDEIKQQIEKEKKELERRETLFRGIVSNRPSLSNRTILIVDECITSGATISSAVKTVQKLTQNDNIIIASPIITERAENRIMNLTNLTVSNLCVAEKPNLPTGIFWNSTDFYNRNRYFKATDEEVIQVLHETIRKKDDQSL